MRIIRNSNIPYDITYVDLHPGDIIPSYAGMDYVIVTEQMIDEFGRLKPAVQSFSTSINGGKKNG